MQTYELSIFEYPEVMQNFVNKSQREIEMKKGNKLSMFLLY